MGRKKKDLVDTYTMLDPKVSDTTTYINKDYLYGSHAPYITPSPYVTTIPGGCSEVVYRPATTLNSEVVYRPATTLTGYDWKNYAELVDKIAPEYKEVNTMSSQEKTPDGTVHMIVCKDEDNLSEENILKNLSSIKGKLMIDVAPIHVKCIECYMTPLVKSNIIKASKRLQMYGKKRPFIARFDEYGRRLPDEISIDTIEGMKLHILDPEEYGKYYFALRAIEFPTIPSYDTDTWYSEDLPF